MRVSFLKTGIFSRFIVLMVWVLVIVWLSLTPKPPNPHMVLFGYDKFFHAMAYGTLTLLAGWAFSGVVMLSSRSWFMIAASAVLISGLVEVAQALLTTTRSAEVADLVANGIGATAALLLVRIAKISRVSGR